MPDTLPSPPRGPEPASTSTPAPTSNVESHPESHSQPLQSHPTAAAAAASTHATSEASAIVQPEAPNPTAPLQIDPAAEVEGFDDADSAVGSANSGASTSLASSILNYVYENGRRYHAFREGQYLLPNDEREQDRLDLQHHIWCMTLDGKLFRAPITSKPQRVLDMGTGTGIWAIQFADEFSSASVIGTDLSPIQPTWVPPNCKFLIDDLESEWAFSRSEPFDFIHGKGLAGSINDWGRLYRQVYDHLKPGGWVEMQEYEGVIASDDDPELKNAPWLDQWQHLVDEATTKIGKKLDVAGAQKQYMIDAGFVDVRDDVYKVPSGRWPKDPKLKEVGMYQLEQLVDCVEPFTLAFFTRVLQWSPEETEVLMARVKKDIRNKQNHFHAKFHFVYGRKPL